MNTINLRPEFETVSISAALHHIEDISQVFAEMKRVLKPGGLFILGEMYREGRTKAQRNVISLHHWEAAVDSALGMSHKKTCARHELMDFLQGLGLSDLACYDLLDIDSNPMDEKALEQAEGSIGRVLRRAQDADNCEILKKRGEELRRQIHKLGIQREPVLVAVGSK